jgi:hypothetical protein
MMKAEEYLKQNVRGILQPMVSAVLLEKPKDPVRKILLSNIVFISNIDTIHDSMAPKLFRDKIKW